jgi:hypothetical protein
MRTRARATLAALATLALSAAAAPAAEARQRDAAFALTAEEQAAGWRLLFDGRDTGQWRGYRQATLPAGWRAVDGTLARVGPAGGGDIISVEQFDSFELALEWRIQAGGNSGIFFHVLEAGDYVWETGPEYQILDDAAHRDVITPAMAVGSNYALHAPVQSVARPLGEWNSARLVVRGDSVEHWLNDVRVVAYRLGSPDWERRVAASKFAAMPGYGRARRGHIALQDHDSPVWFRAIRIRPLPPVK